MTPGQAALAEAAALELARVNSHGYRCGPAPAHLIRELVDAIAPHPAQRRARCHECDNPHTSVRADGTLSEHRPGAPRKPAADAEFCAAAGTRARRRPPHVHDTVVVDRAIQGQDPGRPLSHTEAAEAISQLAAHGLTDTRIGARLGLTAAQVYGRRTKHQPVGRRPNNTVQPAQAGPTEEVA